jgi:hypothetical protein
MDDLKEKAFEEFSKDVRALYMAFKNAGFTYDEAFSLTKGYVENAGALWANNTYSNVQKERYRQAILKPRKEANTNAD